MHVKICGLTRVDDALAAARAGADFAGFVLAPSPRCVTPTVVQSIVRSLPPTTRPVLVFRDAPLADVLAAQRTTHCTWLQLHGQETVDYLRDLLRELPDARLIRAWDIVGPESADRLVSYLDQARSGQVNIEVVLLDSPKAGPRADARVFADTARRCTQRPPAVWCAGGLTPDNLGPVIGAGVYDGVDVSSGVEAAPGVKDHDRIRRFVARVKAAAERSA